jgi:high affinity Mn2+ porin
MRPSLHLNRLAALMAASGLLLPTLPALAAPSDAQLQQLIERIEKLESRNTELEMQVKALKGESEQIAKGLDSPRLSQDEPELTVRLKAVEKDALEMKKSAHLADKLDGIAVGATLTTVAQRASGLPDGTVDAGSQLNYRADVTVELPLDAVGDIDQKVFAHVRIGQGQGLNAPLGNLGYFASAPNSVAFRASGANADDSVAILGQAWYQAAIPLPYGGFRPHSREKLELTFGKVDIFGFFDQNDAAGDESVQFLNSVFVHNPLLDAGGEVAVDANGFQPGFIASYVNESDKSQPWRLSLGAFGAGDKGASYQRSLSSPLLMLQAEQQLKLFGGLTGNYRAYVWSRSDVTELDGVTLRRHTGIGISADQRIDDGITLFGRYGHQSKGELPVDRALSIGAEFNGSYWGRAGDAIGIGGSWLKSSNALRAAGGSGDLDGDGVADFSYTPSGAEKVAEIFYRYRISPQFSLTPDLQRIHRAGANPDARNATVVSLRANLAY